MDLCTPHFGKKLDELNYSDIHQYFSDLRVETDQIEFKSFSSSLDDGMRKIIQSTCAFLNSKGGVIIWGAPKKVQEAYSGPLVPLTERMDEDRIVSKISDKITPLPRGIRPRFLVDSSSRYVCVIEIDESNYAPHQVVGDNYFMRIEGQTRIAPHHYLEALFRKVRYPNIEGYLRIAKVRHERYDLNKIRFDITIQVQIYNWSALQNGEDVFFMLSLGGARFPDGKVNVTSESTPILHLGLAKSKHFDLTTSTELTADKAFTFDIDLLFGAKNSPAKLSAYTISLNKILNDKSGTYVDVMTDVSENVMFSDLQERLGKNRELILKEFLGRDPRSA